MHSRRMRTSRLLTVYQHTLPGGVPAQGECLPRGVYQPMGCTYPGAKISPCPKFHLWVVINGQPNLIVVSNGYS